MPVFLGPNSFQDTCTKLQEYPGSQYTRLKFCFWQPILLLNKAVNQVQFPMSNNCQFAHSQLMLVVCLMPSLHQCTEGIDQATFGCLDMCGWMESSLPLVKAYHMYLYRCHYHLGLRGYYEYKTINQLRTGMFPRKCTHGKLKQLA